MKKLLILFLSAALTSVHAFSPPAEDEPKRSLWDTGGYLGFDFGYGDIKSEPSFADPDKRWNGTGGGLRIAPGYKLPFLRIGVEAGVASGSQEFQSEVEALKRDKYGFTSFHLMPQIFLELDWPGYIVPYVGYAAGVNVLRTRQNVHVVTSVWPPRTEEEYKSDSSTGQTAAVLLGLRGALNPFVYYNLFWRKQDYGRVKMSPDHNRIIGREVNTGLVILF